MAKVPAVPQNRVKHVNTHTRVHACVCAGDSSGGLEALVPQVAGGSDR